MNHDIDLICLSHLRWNFVYQRPQHLLSRCAHDRRVIFFEEARYMTPGSTPYLEVTAQQENGAQPIWVVVPHLPDELPAAEHDATLAELLDQLLRQLNVHYYVLWYYTPFALNFTRQLQPLAVAYDCMDELSAFKGASPEIRELERELFDRADVVFTGGQSLYEAKRQKHANVHAFPSSIDAAHFGQARQRQTDPLDQAEIPHPRLGFFGVIDERFDRELIAQVAQLRPAWHFVCVGPVVKIDPAELPQYSNIHYLGQKLYQELPHYLANWDVALLPFALNEATRFISPTKTPEYLAGGKPVVSTPIRDVIRPYGDKGLVRIAGTPEAFVQAVEQSLEQGASAAWLSKVDTFLADMSWDKTWQAMWQQLRTSISVNATPPRQVLRRAQSSRSAPLSTTSPMPD